MFFGGQIHDEAFANASPAWFFAAPLEATAGPGQLFAIEQAAARPNHAVAEVATGAKKDVPMLKRVKHGDQTGSRGVSKRLFVGRDVP